MIRKTAKQAALEAINTLPDDSSFEDIMEEIYFIQRIDAGIKDLEEGKTHTHEEVKQKINQWLK